MSAPGDGSFVVDVLFEDQASEVRRHLPTQLNPLTTAAATTAFAQSNSHKTQVLQLPVLRPKAARKLLSDARRSVPILGSGQLPTTEDTLEQFLQHAGNLFGKDPSKWEKVGKALAVVLTSTTLRPQPHSHASSITGHASVPSHTQLAPSPACCVYLIQASQPQTSQSRMGSALSSAPACTQERSCTSSGRHFHQLPLVSTALAEQTITGS